MQKPPQAPPLFNGTPGSIVVDARAVVENKRKVQDQLVQAVRPDHATFANVIQPLANAENGLHAQSHMLGFYTDVSADPELRDASAEAQRLFNDFAIESAMREDLFALVDAVLGKQEDLRLDGISSEIISDLEKGTGENEGKLRLTFEFHHLIPAQMFAKDGEIRKRCTLGYENKCNANIPIFKEVMLLRDEAARLLGYPNHATFRIEEKMAKTPETVNTFLEDLRSRLASGGQKELQNLIQLKRADLESRNEPFDGRFFLWDLAFYKQIMLEQQFSIDQQKIAEYFPLQTSIDGMLEIFQHLFGLTFVEIEENKRNDLAESGNGGELVWHEDVQLFAVWDDVEEGGGFLGYLYLDLFPRDGKYGTPANFNVQPGFCRADGTRQYPSTALVCSFTKPTAETPSLLRHDELVTLFHELGHGIHDLVSKTLYARFHGTMMVIDFGEAPSQMLENWCWTPSTLQSLSRHYSSLSPRYLETWKARSEGGEPVPPVQIPDKVINKLIRTRHVNGALFQLRVLQFSIFDMMVHEPTSHEALERMNMSVEYNKLRKDLMKIDGPEVLGEDYEWGHGEGNFGHVMGDYDAGYYGYLYSQVFADDIFHTVFQADPMNAQEGRRYRYGILEKGGSQDEMKTVMDFLGRQPSSDAFYRELGLVEPPA
ncbi:hypothetical protein BP5796_11512 [Coleophoma crateriformis]|uniref:Peptidase M3A/M3B catalytic domain-containing protein n=1 Tax=Coleophoma crateriformis TaxID=565419 RepID=A0A3D8QIX5_9HELO|nr:hypothetical protein BP5796_11512 [Coleophoma crateriformis]